MLGSLCRSAPPQPLLGCPSTPVPTPGAQVLRSARASSPPLFTRGNEQAVSDGSRGRVATVNTLHGSVAEVRAQEETPLLVFFPGLFNYGVVTLCLQILVHNFGWHVIRKNNLIEGKTMIDILLFFIYPFKEQQ